MTQPGREVNGVNEIVVDRDPAALESVIHDIELHSDVLFTWDYERSRTALVKLYEKAKTSQWNASTDLPWDMLTTEPLLKQLLRYVMSDEARHVAFGVLSLREFYEGLDGREIRERQEFAYEAAVRLRNRFMVQDVWERLGADPREVIAFLKAHPNPGQEMFQTMLFSKIVPNVRKLGLLDAGDGWLRTKFTELGIIQFEDGADTSEEYGDLDAVAADRALTTPAQVGTA
jgi:hypothetical protein